MIQLTHEPIDAATLLEQAQSPEAGAVVMFLGVARRMTRGRETVELTYDAYEKMAAKELDRLETEARERWELFPHLPAQLADGRAGRQGDGDFRLTGQIARCRKQLDGYLHVTTRSPLVLLINCRSSGISP